MNYFIKKTPATASQLQGVAIRFFRVKIGGLQGKFRLHFPMKKIPKNIKRNNKPTERKNELFHHENTLDCIAITRGSHTIFQS